MPDTFYGVTVPGAQVVGSVLKQASTTGRNVELRITDGVADNSKVEVLKAISPIRYAVATNPPN